MNSRVLGRCGPAMIWLAASSAALLELKPAVMPRTGPGAGSSPTVISVITPRVPSDPTSNDVRSSPPTAFTVGGEVRITSPLASTTSSERTASRVTPYLTQRIPPALVATFPPSVDSAAEAGSGA